MATRAPANTMLATSATTIISRMPATFRPKGHGNISHLRPDVAPCTFILTTKIGAIDGIERTAASIPCVSEHGAMKLGMSTGYWGAGPPKGAAEAVIEADRLGFDSVWTAEAYGSDALTPLAWWGAATSHVKLGTAIMQMSARTPAATAMAAMTLDHLS